MQTTDEKIVGLALKYGYDSPTSFNRAFQNMHGVAPSTACLEGTSLKACPHIRITISILKSGAVCFNSLKLYEIVVFTGAFNVTDRKTITIGININITIPKYILLEGVLSG